MLYFKILYIFANRLNIILFFITIFGCNADEYSPNQKFNRNTPTAVNSREISQLPAKASGTTIKIAVSGDTQRSYKQSEDFVALINVRNDIDFVVLNGDISDFGLLLEFNGSTPNMEWLRNNLKLDAGTNRILAFSHVSPFDGDFDPKISSPYQDLLNQTPAIASIHSHQHQPQIIRYQNQTGIPFTITDGQIAAEEINF